MKKNMHQPSALRCLLRMAPLLKSHFVFTYGNGGKAAINSRTEELCRMIDGENKISKQSKIDQKKYVVASNKD